MSVLYILSLNPWYIMVYFYIKKVIFIFLHLYQSSPTANLKDGTIVSEEGTETSPIVTTLDASLNQESSPIKLGLRCDFGFQTQGSTTIIPFGSSNSKWSLSLNGTTWQPYGNSITIPSIINDTNTIFYAKGKATSDENPKNDISCQLQTSTVIVAV